MKLIFIFLGSATVLVFKKDVQTSVVDLNTLNWIRILNFGPIWIQNYDINFEKSI